jgi:hypothetical protein
MKTLDNFVWPEDGSMQSATFYKRHEDMSPDGHIALVVEEDGDVILIVQNSSKGGKIGQDGQRASVQFCTFGGGGQSRHTRNALLYLIQAIQQDNAETPQYRKAKD